MRAIAYKTKRLRGYSRSKVVGVKAQPQHLRNACHYCERIGVNRLHNTAERGNLSAANYAKEHGAVFLGVHARCRNTCNAAAKLFHERTRHFFGLGGDNSKLNRRLKAVCNRVVNLAFDIRFKHRHHDREYVYGKECAGVVEYEEVT